MADDSAKATSGAGKARPSQSSPEREPEEERRYTREELIEGAHGLLDVSPHAVAGALHGVSRETHTLGQAEKLVNDFLRREVRVAES